MTERELGLILAKLENMQEDFKEVSVIMKDNNKRVSSLEGFRSWVIGAGSVIAVLFAGFQKYLYSHIGG